MLAAFAPWILSTRSHRRPSSGCPGCLFNDDNGSADVVVHEIQLILVKFVPGSDCTTSTSSLWSCWLTSGGSFFGETNAVMNYHYETRLNYLMIFFQRNRQALLLSSVQWRHETMGGGQNQNRSSHENIYREQQLMIIKLGKGDKTSDQHLGKWNRDDHKSSCRKTG